MTTQKVIDTRIVNPSIAVKDVTLIFREAASYLTSGTLIKDEPFSLFEAVGALEIGDPKMDSGQLKYGEALEDNYDIEVGLSAQQILWLMDELLCVEVAWLQGYPLSQTLFTSVYIDHLLWPEPRNLHEASFSRGMPPKPGGAMLHELLRPYCLALIKSCGLVHEMVTSQHYYEEEDFASQLFNRDLLRPFAVNEILALVDAALEWLVCADIRDDVRRSIDQRLRCRRLILQLLQTNQGVQRSQPAVEMSINELLKQINDSVPLGRPVPDAFTLKIQRSLASSVPPRPMVRVEMVQALEYVQGLFTNSADLVQVLHAQGSSDLLTAYWLYMSRRPEPSVYIRALLQSLLDQNDGVARQYSPKALIVDDLDRLVLPGSLLLDPSNDDVEVPTDKRHQLAKLLKDFVARTELPFINLYRTSCLNRCRVRRNLCHAIIEWDQLQAEAEDIDANLQVIINEKPRAYPEGNSLTYPYHLSSWAYHHKLCQMEMLVQTGFELSVYAPSEISSMYWYLSHLTSVHLAHLDRISFFTEQSGKSRSALQESSRNSPSMHKTRVDASLQFLYRHYTRLKATEALARGLHLLYLFLHRRCHSTNVRLPYASDKLRYELRMRPFLHLSVPEPLEHSDFDNATSAAYLSDLELLDEAQHATDVAKRALDDVRNDGWNCQRLLPSRAAGSVHTNENAVVESNAESIKAAFTFDIKNTLKACIAVKVVIAVVRRTPGQQSFKVPKPGEKSCWHDCWLVPKIGE